MNLLKNVKVQEVGAPVANASNTDDNSDRLDMANWDGVMFIATITDSAATGVATLTVEQNTADSNTGMAALSGGSSAKTCTVNDDINNTLLIVDVFRPRERYVQGVRTSGTANIAFGSILAIQYSGRKFPITQPASVSTATQAVSPAEA